MDAHLLSEVRYRYHSIDCGPGYEVNAKMAMFPLDYLVLSSQYWLNTSELRHFAI